MLVNKKIEETYHVKSNVSLSCGLPLCFHLNAIMNIWIVSIILYWRHNFITYDTGAFTLSCVVFIVEYQTYVVVCCVSLKCNKSRRTKISTAGKLTLSTTDRDKIVTSCTLSHKHYSHIFIILLQYSLCHKCNYVIVTL